MAVKRVNMHMSGQLHSALKEIAGKRNVKSFDVIEGMVGRLPDMSKEAIDHVRSLPEIPKKSTIKVMPEARDKFREKADSYGISMATYLMFAAANFYDIANLKSRFGSSSVSNAAPVKEDAGSRTEKAVKADSGVLFSEPENPNKGSGIMNFEDKRSSNTNLIDHYTKIGKRSLDLSNMTADEVRQVLEEGGPKASVIKQRMAAIKKDEERAAKDRERRMAKKINGSKSSDAIVAAFQEAAADFRRENGIEEVKKPSPKPVEAPKGKLEVREILVKDVDFDVECRQLSEIVDKLDKSIDKLSDLKRSGSNYASLNDAIKGNNAAVFMINRYITQRTRIHHRMEAERDSADEAVQKENAA